jgi:hypothetical protein
MPTADAWAQPGGRGRQIEKLTIGQRRNERTLTQVPRRCPPARQEAGIAEKLCLSRDCECHLAGDRTSPTVVGVADR